MCLRVNNPEPPRSIQLHQKTKVNSKLSVQGDSSVGLPDESYPWNIHDLRLPQHGQVRVQISDPAAGVS